MTDAPYAHRLGRAILLVVIGVALHLPRPAGIPFPVPPVRPLTLPETELADAEVVRGDPAIVVEYSEVFARPVSELDHNGTARPREIPVGTAGVILADLRVAPEAPRPVAVERPAEPRPAAAAAIERHAAATDAPAPADDGDGPAAPRVAPKEARPSAPEPPPAVATPIDEEALVRQLIDRYTGALERLDVGAAQAAWPTVDGKALKRAFGQLSAQRLTLQSCGITISGSTANARCRGSATYRPRIGSRADKIASREWTFDLSKQDAAWRIVNTFVR